MESTHLTATMSHPGPTGRNRAHFAITPYLTALVLPALATAFFAARGLAWLVGAAWLLALVSFALLDAYAAPVARTRRPASRGWPFSVLLVVLAALQIANLVLFAARLQASQLVSVDAVSAIVVAGVTSAFTSVVVAHELIHQPGWRRGLGRVLLWTALYEEFFTEHLRGHHVRVAGGRDPLAARAGEPFWPYAMRSSWGEIRSAWVLARARAARTGHNDFARGISAELVLASGLFALGGEVLLGFVLHALLARVLIAAVNYLEHWGLLGPGGPGRPVAWDSSAWASHHALLGLSFHAHHHAHASRPFQRLARDEQSPELPHGYFRMVAMTVFRSDKARRLLASARMGRGPSP